MMPRPPADVPALDYGTDRFVLGCLDPSAEERYAHPEYADHFEVLGPHRWQEIDLGHHFTEVWHQGPRASCAGFAGVMALMIDRAASGRPTVALSPTYPYALVNGGVDYGTSLSAIMAALRDVGTCTSGEFGHDAVFLHQAPQSARTTAYSYRMAVGYAVRTFRDVASSLTQGRPVAFGIRIGPNFNHPDADGVVPMPDVTRGGHALCAVSLRKFRGQWQIGFRGSYGPRWGPIGGHGYVHEGHFGVGLIDGFAVVASADTPAPDDGDTPPVVTSVEPTAAVVEVAEVTVSETAVPAEESAPTPATDVLALDHVVPFRVIVPPSPDVIRDPEPAADTPPPQASSVVPATAGGDGGPPDQPTAAVDAEPAPAAPASTDRRVAKLVNLMRSMPQAAREAEMADLARREPALAAQVAAALSYQVAAEPRKHPPHGGPKGPKRRPK